MTVAALVAVALVGCGGGEGEIGPTNTASGNGNPGGSTPPPANAPTTALFQPLQGLLPYPTDLYFKDSKDGTLNIPANSLIPLQAGVNSLDGFSTNAVIRAPFASPLNALSLKANVRVVQLTLDNSTKAPKTVTRPLAVDTDYTVGLAGDTGVGSTIVEIRPLKPLEPSTGATNVGYLVILTKGITTAAGGAATPDTDYANFKAALPTCASVPAALTGLCQLTGAHLTVAAGLGIDAADVVLTFSFSTQNTRDTMSVLANPAVTTAQPILVQNTGATTQAIAAALPGHANLYAGVFTIPYYLTRPTAQNPTAPLTQAWQGNPSTLDATSRFLTRFNPVPVATETIQIPILVTVPNATSTNPAHGVKPGSGYPVIIYQHGLTRNRLDAGGIADAAADLGNFVVVSIDLPLHGIAGPTAEGGALYQAGRERTFDLDLVDNDNGAAGPDGKIDISGTHFVNIPTPLVTRDNLRQGAVDLLALTRSLANLDLDGDGNGDIDPTRIHFIGHSLGGIVGGVYLGTAGAAEVRTGELISPGGGVAQTIFDSPAFGPRIKTALAAQGITEGSTIYAQFIRDAQTIVDAGDPVNYIASAKAARPLLILQVSGGGTLPNGSVSPEDQVVKNDATARLITAAGGLPKISTAGPNATMNGYVSFILGHHGSIIDPSISPLANAAVTQEMQVESILFARDLGTQITIANPTVVQP